MKYYFDESGNWEELRRRESKRLVMCAVLFKDDQAFKDVDFEFKNIRADLNLTPFEFHATSLDERIRERVYSVMNSSLASDRVSAWAIRVNPEHLKKTRKKETDIYIEYASGLLSKIAMCDDRPEILSDMKFRGAYPGAVSELASNPSFRTNYRFLDDIMTSYSPMEDKMSKKIDNIRQKLEKALKNRQTKDMVKVKDMIDSGSDIDVIKRYEFAELWLNWTERERSREKYREAILREIQGARRSLGMTEEISNVSLRFVDKNENNAGIQFADFMCNIIYKNFPDRKFSQGSLENKIYDKCIIEEEHL